MGKLQDYGDRLRKDFELGGVKAEDYYNTLIRSFVCLDETIKPNASNWDIIKQCTGTILTILMVMSRLGCIDADRLLDEYAEDASIYKISFKEDKTDGNK